MSYPPGPAAPNYGQPPRKNHAGLIIVLLLVLLIAVLGVGGVLGYRLVSGKTARPGAAPETSATKSPTAADAGDLARRFVAQLNANNPTAATALACADSKKVLTVVLRNDIKPPTKLTTGTPYVQETVFMVPVAGTTKGTPVTGYVSLHAYHEPLCVSMLNVTPR